VKQGGHSPRWAAEPEKIIIIITAKYKFTISKGFSVRSTFPHKDMHKETRYSADGRIANQIDHVLN
jgi:hypothetical protein